MERNPLANISIDSIEVPYWELELLDVRNATADVAQKANRDTHCGYAARLFLSVDTGSSIEDPTSLNIGYASLIEYLRYALPAQAVLGAQPGQILDWWITSTVKDSASTTEFLRQLTGSCASEICSENAKSYDQDISGIGLLISNALLTFICTTFFVYTLFHVRTRANGKSRRHNCENNIFCTALRGTIEDLFDALLIFSITLHVATFDYRDRSANKRDALYAENLCTFVSMASMAMWHMRAEISRRKLTTQVAFLVQCALDLVIFVLKCLPHRQPVDFFGPICPGSINLDSVSVSMSLVTTVGLVLWCICSVTVLVPIRQAVERMRGRPFSANATKLWRMFQALTGIGSMCLHMCLLFASRNGFVDGQNWGIGQYLAVATWAPALCKMLYIVMVGSEKAFTAVLPKPWIAALPQTASRELGSPKQDGGLFQLRRRGTEETLVAQEEGVLDEEGLESQCRDPGEIAMKLAIALSLRAVPEKDEVT